MNYDEDWEAETGSNITKAVLMSLGMKPSEATKVVSEIYSPPRISAKATYCPSLGFSVGFALDLTTNDENGKPWDFSRIDQRNKARSKVINEKPALLVGSPNVHSIFADAATQLRRDGPRAR